MKYFRNLPLFLVILIVLTGCCKKKKKAAGPEMIGVFNEELNQVIIIPGKEDEVGEALGGTVRDTSAYFTFQGREFNTSVDQANNLLPFYSGATGIYPQGQQIPIILRIYWKAECNNQHAGFISPCMGTFGPHRARGNSMIWTVNNWTSCGQGESFCIERLQSIGDITYHPDWNCMDTLFTRMNIVRFACP